MTDPGAHRRVSAGPEPGSPAAAITRIVLRPMASPLPLGFLGLGVASVLVSSWQLHWVSTTDTHLAALTLLAFTVPLQALSSVFGLFARDVVASTGMAVLAGTWASTALILLATKPGSLDPFLGVLLLAAAVALLVPVGVAACSGIVVAVVVAAAACRFGFTAVYQLSGSAWWQHSAGVIGLVAAGLALYGAAAVELEGGLGRTVLPLLRHHAGRRAHDGRLLDQVAGLADEAGVRQQL